MDMRMRVSKASERDIEAAGDAMSVLNAISTDYYPTLGDDEGQTPTFFDPDDPAHLRRFYDLMAATLNKSAGWPNRVIGGMCFVVLYEVNEIVDPAADTLELHPRFARVAAQRDQLLAEMRNIALAKPSEWDPEVRDQFQEWAQNRARAAIARVEGDGG